MYKTIKDYVSKAVKTIGLTALLSVPGLAAEPTLTTTYVSSDKPVVRYELFIPKKQAHAYLVKEGDFEKVRFQHTPWQLGDLELGLAAQVVNGEPMLGPALSVKKAERGSFSKADLRYFHSKRLLDLYAFSSHKDGVFVSTLAGYDLYKSQGFVQAELLQALGHGWSLGYGLKAPLGHSDKGSDKRLLVRKEIKF